MTAEEATPSKAWGPRGYQWYFRPIFADRKTDITQHVIRQMRDIHFRLPMLPGNDQYSFERRPDTEMPEQIINFFRNIIYT